MVPQSGLSSPADLSSPNLRARNTFFETLGAQETRVQADARVHITSRQHMASYSVEGMLLSSSRTMNPISGSARLPMQADLSNLRVKNTFLEASGGEQDMMSVSDRAATEPIMTRRKPKLYHDSFSVSESLSSDTFSEERPEKRPEKGEVMDIRFAARSAREDMDLGIAEQASLAAIRNMTLSVTVADPSLEDCPLIGCSDGFEVVTGYLRREIVGQNCRFLNQGLELEPALRASLREAVRTGREFIGIVPNLRANGERFNNLLHMSTLEIRGKVYILGIQADVTNVEMNLGSPGHVEALKAAVELIFESNINAWVQMQAKEFSMRLPAPYSEILKLCAPDAFKQERDNFVRTGVAKSDDTLGNLAHYVQLKSLGSAGHPSDCTECYFHVYNPGGCRAGRSCAFCHELHPRSNPKKNRRLMKKLMAGLAAQGAIPPGVCSTTTSHPRSVVGSSVASSEGQKLMPTMPPLSPASTTASMTPVISVPAPKPHRAEPVQTELATPPHGMELKPVNWSRQNYTVDTASTLAPREESSHSSSDQSGISQKLGNVDFMRVRYKDSEPSSEPNSSQSGEPAALVLVAGFQTYFPARVDITSMKQEAMRKHIEFSVEPALPSGLALQKSSGLICGVPLEPQEAPTTHRITVSIDATGPGGISLGALVLTSCIISVRVVDLHSYILYWVEEKIDTEDGGHILLKLQKC